MKIEISDGEISLLFDHVFQKYSVDYRGYNINHLRRRVIHRISVSGHKSFSSFQQELFSSPSFFYQFIQDLSINVTGMFREPGFFVSLREAVFPCLATLPEIKIWVAGCSTGEEAYSLAILLQEENLLSKSKIIATDYNETLLEIASRGEYSLPKMDEFRKKYMECGKKDFDGYFTPDGAKMKVSSNIIRKIVFANHNLVKDRYFSEIDLLLCRNVMIYFNLDLQIKVLDGFLSSLKRNGFMGLGKQEDICSEHFKMKFSSIDPEMRIFRKISI